MTSMNNGMLNGDLGNPNKPSLTPTTHTRARSYELEKGLIDGSIEVDDLPKLWAEKMEQYLGGFSRAFQGCLGPLRPSALELAARNRGWRG